MRRYLIFAALIVMAFSSRDVVLFGSIPDPTVREDFTTGTLSSWITATGGVNGTTFNVQGCLVAKTAPRYYWDPQTHVSKGILTEQLAANIVLRNRDMTQASWVKTNITPALDQVGLDCGANSASSILATAGNATVLQTTSQGSFLRSMTAWVKYINVTGEIDMTQDNGSTWTALDASSCYQENVPTAPNMVTWVRCTVPHVTSANPIVGFRIVNSGDKIAVDGVQNEALANPTSTILTAGASVNRTADALSGTIAGSGVNPAAGTIAVKFQSEPGWGAAQPNTATVFEGVGGTGIAVSYSSAGTTMRNNSFHGSGTRATWSNAANPAPGVLPAISAVSWGGGFKVSSTNGITMLNSGNPAESDWGATVTFGNRSGTSQFFNGWISAYACYPVMLTQGQQNKITGPGGF